MAQRIPGSHIHDLVFFKGVFSSISTAPKLAIICRACRQSQRTDHDRSTRLSSLGLAAVSHLGVAVSASKFLSQLEVEACTVSLYTIMPYDSAFAYNPPHRS